MGLKATLFAIFFFPGMLFAKIEYLFPSRGNVIGSGRRVDNVFVHALYSAVFWAFLGYIAAIKVVSLF